MTAAGPRDLIDDPVVTDEAHTQAQAAAGRAGVRIRLVNELADLEAVEGLINQTWQNPTAEISLGVLRALSKSENLVAAAYHDRTLVGVCIGFVGGVSHAYLHSHLAAVHPQHRARGVGFALKLHQRAWALERGIHEISWTFDPLVRRNARLNIARLGAEPIEYLPDFYGTRQDALNVNVPTDRVLVVWPLLVPRTRTACSRGAPPADVRQLVGAGARVLLAPGPDEGPVLTLDPGGTRALVGLPEDITRLRRERPRVAASWRDAVRATLAAALAEGDTVSGFTEQGHYVIERRAVTPSPS